MPLSVISASLAADAAVTAPPRLRRLRRRSQFLHASRGERVGGREFALQAAPVPDPVPGVGFTVTKKVGNAPERNRIKRRLRAVAATCAGDFAPYFDYVMVGRRAALSAPFTALVDRLRVSIGRIHAQSGAGERAKTGRAERP